MNPRGMGRGRGATGKRPRRIRRFLEPALLLLLHRGPNHGYGLVEGLRDLGLESYPADISAVYRVLYSLEAKGLVNSEQRADESAGPPRRVYALNESGCAYLNAWVDDLRETDRVLHRFLEAYDEHQLEHAQDDPAHEHYRVDQSDREETAE